jgi:hypothetical protein
MKEDLCSVLCSPCRYMPKKSKNFKLLRLIGAKLRETPPSNVGVVVALLLVCLYLVV